MIKKQIEEFRHCRHSKLKKQGVEPVRNVKVLLQVENLESEKFSKHTGKTRSTSKRSTKNQHKTRSSMIELNTDPTTPRNNRISYLLPPIVQTEKKGVVSADRRHSNNKTTLSTNYGGSETIDIGSN